VQHGAVSLLELFLPPSCSGCGRYGEALCARCRSTFRPAGRTRDRFVLPDPAVVVGDDLAVAVAAFAYSGALRRALARLKYGGSARLAQPLAVAALPLLAPMLDAAQRPILVPVPVHRDRLRQRGYNQARLLATALAAAWNIPCLDVLVRRRPTVQQHRLNRTQRLRNLREAFELAPGTRAPPEAVLVDDILTTAATLEACAGVLLATGSDVVRGLTIAREI
jgi:ComF family protein